MANSGVATEYYESVCARERGVIAPACADNTKQMLACS